MLGSHTTAPGMQTRSNTGNHFIWKTSILCPPHRIQSSSRSAQDGTSTPRRGRLKAPTCSFKAKFSLAMAAIFAWRRRPANARQKLATHKQVDEQIEQATWRHSILKCLEISHRFFLFRPSYLERRSTSNFPSEPQVFLLWLQGQDVVS